MRPQEVDPSGGVRELGISLPLEHPLASTMPVYANAPVTVLGPIFVPSARSTARRCIQNGRAWPILAEETAG